MISAMILALPQESYPCAGEWTILPYFILLALLVIGMVIVAGVGGSVAFIMYASGGGLDTREGWLSMLKFLVWAIPVSLALAFLVLLLAHKWLICWLGSRL